MTYLNIEDPYHSASHRFYHELEIFSREVDEVTKSLYAYVAINDLAMRHPSVLAALNSNPTFWTATVDSLLASTFIALGRILKSDGAHNVHSLLRAAEQGREIFSRQALGTRARFDVSRAFEPDAAFFRKLRKQVSRRRAMYEDRYDRLRNDWFAHKSVVEPDEVFRLFQSTKTLEIQQLLLFLAELHSSLWHLFHNGTKPRFRQRPHSVRGIRRAIASSSRSTRPSEVVTRDAMRVFGVEVKPRARGARALKSGHKKGGE